MILSDRPAAKTKLIGGRLCLDFINTVGGRTPGTMEQTGEPIAGSVRADKLVDYFDLLAWGQHTGLLTDAETQSLVREARRNEKEAAETFSRAVVFREALYRIFGAMIYGRSPRTDDLALLNQEEKVAHEHRRLMPGGSNLLWEWTGAKNKLDRMLWPIAESAVEILTGGDLTRLHECRGENCGWLFEDVSKNRRRQWCDMQDCGNLAKVRAFRKRREDLL